MKEVFYLDFDHWTLAFLCDIVPGRVYAYARPANAPDHRIIPAVGSVLSINGYAAVVFMAANPLNPIAALFSIPSPAPSSRNRHRYPAS